MLKRRIEFNENDLKFNLNQLRQKYRLNLSQGILSTLETQEKYDEESMSKVNQSNKDSETLPGRTTGSEEWRRSRKELGDTSSGSARKIERPPGTKYKKIDFREEQFENKLKKGN